MLCVFNITTVCSNLINVSSSTCTESDMSMNKKYTRTKSPPKVRNETPVSKPKTNLPRLLLRKKSQSMRNVSMLRLNLTLFL